jgi:transcriptional regulator with XRE-family HTH domain
MLLLYRLGTSLSTGRNAGLVRDDCAPLGYRTAMVTRVYATRRGYLYIAEWMAHRGLSDEQVAGRLDVARETVTRWRGQQHRLNPQKIAALATALNLEPEELWRAPPPIGHQSLDAIVKNSPQDIQDMAVDIILRLIQRR